MDPTGTTSDGILFGAQDITIGTTTWTCSAFSLTFPTNALDSGNSYGAWRGSAYRDGKGTGNLTLKYPDISGATTNGGTTGIALPARRIVFAAKTKGGTTVNLIITQVGENQGDEAEPSIPITVAEAKHLTPPA